MSLYALLLLQLMVVNKVCITLKKKIRPLENTTCCTSASYFWTLGMCLALTAIYSTSVIQIVDLRQQDSLNVHRDFDGGLIHLHKPRSAEAAPPGGWLTNKFDWFPTKAFLSIDTIPVTNCYKPGTHPAFWAIDNGQMVPLLSWPHCVPSEIEMQVHTTLHENLTVSIQCPPGYSSGTYGTALLPPAPSDGGSRLIRSPTKVLSPIPVPLIEWPVDLRTARGMFGTDGIAWVFARCDPLPGPLPAEHNTRRLLSPPPQPALPSITQFALRPYAVPEYVELGRQRSRIRTTQPLLNVLVLVLDSTSRELFNHIMPRVKKALRTIEQSGVAEVFRFKQTSVMGMNTKPNVEQMFVPTEGGANLFWVAKDFGYVASFEEDYNPDHGAAELFTPAFPAGSHFIHSQNLLHNFGDDMRCWKDTRGKIASGYQTTKRPIALLPPIRLPMREGRACVSSGDIGRRFTLS